MKYLVAAMLPLLLFLVLFVASLAGLVSPLYWVGALILLIITFPALLVAAELSSGRNLSKRLEGMLANPETREDELRQVAELLFQVQDPMPNTPGYKNWGDRKQRFANSKVAEWRKRHNK